VADGFVYTKVRDPYNGQKVITDAVRSDGKVMLLDNVWTSKTRNRDTSPPSWEYWVNVFDVNSTGNYTITMGDLVIGPLPPVIQVITDKVTHEGKQVGFLVESSDPNGDSVSLTAEPLPIGATFVDNGNGTAFFNWTPSVGQAGTYLITYKATDGVLTSKRTATIRVNPVNDTDGDGLDDAWELEQFGSLDQDGSGDSDGDGISDLDEFLNGTDPNLAPPPAPNDLAGTSGNLQVYLSWSDVAGATDYRVYWSETPNVSKELSELIDGVLSPFAHTGLLNNKPYYYALTSVGPGGESELSAEIEVIPGNKNWGTPGAVENSANDILEYQVANSNNDTGIAVWTENDNVHTNVWASVYAIDTGWATPQLVELSDTADASSIRVEMDGLGNGIVLWKQTDATTESLWSNTYTAGSWNTPLQIAGADAGELGQAEIILTNSGAAMVAWLQADAGQTQMSNVWASLLYSNASAWNTAEAIDSTLSDEVSGLQLANDGLGNVLAVWSQTLDSGSSYNFAFNRFTNSAWGTDQLIHSGMLADATAPVVKPAMAVNQQGDAVIAWTEVNSVNSVMAMRFTIATGWETASLVEFDDVNAAYDPSVAISDTGDAIVVWTQSNATQDAIYSNRYKPTFGWEPNTLMVSSSATGDPIGVASLPEVEMDTTGNVVVVWQQTDSVQSNIWSNRYDLITGWEGSMIIDYLNDGDAINPVVTMDATGNAVVLWIYNDGVSRDLLFNDLNASNTGMPNILPVVKIPADLTVNENDAVVIDGSASFDQDGFIALYEWSQVSGTPVTLDLTNGIYTHTLSFAAPSLPAPETLIFR
ncbi:MAG: cadherin-like domain-containing protein, partial [Candidatus Pacearchaeota archaeon]|nr:cadherin-like domain-containing protein [Candidatus Pacearchaeota archaeon]